MSEEKHFFWNYLSLGFGQVGSYICQLVLTVLIVRAINPDGFGIFSLFLMIGAIICMLLIDWPNPSIIRYGKEEFIETDTILEMFWARFALLIVTYSIIIVFLFILKDYIDSYIGIKYASFLLLGYVCSLSGGLFISNILQTVGKIKLFSFMNFISKFLILIIFIIIMIAFESVTIVDVILIYILSQITIVIIGIATLDKKCILPVKISKEKILKIIKFSWPMIFGAISSILYTYTSTILINHYMTISDVGIYSVSFFVMTILSTIILSISYLLLPIVASIKTQKRTQIIYEFINEIVPQGVFFWSLFVSLSAIVCSISIPIIFGPSFAQATTPMLILLIGASFLSITAFHTCVLMNYDYMKALVWHSIIFAFFILIASLVLIPLFGLNGAAFAVSLSYFLINSPLIYPKLLNYFGSTMIQKNYLLTFKSNFPILLIVPICIFIDNLPLKVILSLLLIAFSIMIARQMNLFKPGMIRIIEYIDMPKFIKTSISRCYCRLLLNNSS